MMNSIHWQPHEIYTQNLCWFRGSLEARVVSCICSAKSQQCLAINTHMGLYSYTKLPYGVKSTPKFFQATMDMILQGTSHCSSNQGDLLIATITEEENLEILSEVSQ